MLDDNLNLLASSSSGDVKCFVFVKLHREDKVPAPDKVANNCGDCLTRRPDSTAVVLFIKNTKVGRVNMNEPLVPHR